MSQLFERLRAALAADYALLEEIGGGGMGLVFRARDLQLDKTVAIKIIRPDMATAAAAERFLREARILASCSHPNIVPVHRAGEADGIRYYVMDFLEGETLAARLERGPLPADEALQLADDLLGALAVVHERGVVHRDVKPSNIVLSQGRALLTDFGISKAPASGQSTLTGAGDVIGTPGFMPPEQLAGGEVGAATDVCAAGMVIFQALTGRPWVFDQQSDHADWSGVPSSAARALRRALAWRAPERFETAGDFRRALRGRAMTGPGRTIAIVTAIAAVLTVAFWPWPRHEPVGGGPMVVAFAPLAAGDGPDALADSLSGSVTLALRAAPDIEFVPADDERSSLTIDGQVSRSGDSVLVTLRGTPRGGSSAAFVQRVSDGRSGIADAVARATLLAIWSNQDSAFRDLPVRALPRSSAGLAMWARAELLYANAQWSAAARAYDDALAADTTCSLCALRRMMITRWLRESVDTALTARLTRSLADFSPPYQSLIRAATESRNRWATLEKLTTDAPRFDLGHFVYGDELFHRGPLAGRSRSLAVQEFALVVALRPGFAPGWEHLAWAAIAEGDSVLAARALGRFEEHSSPDEASTLILRALFNIGISWRFQPTRQAVATTEFVLANPLIAAFPDLRWGPRYLLVFDVPDGVTWLGARYERWPGRPELRTPGIVAQIVGHLASGRIDSGRAAIARLRGESADPEFALAAAGFEAVLLLLDSLPAGTSAEWHRLHARLEPLTRAAGASPAQQRRAAWLLTLLARRAGADDSPWRAAIAGEAPPAPFATMLDADARSGTAPREALRRTEPLLALDSAGRAGDPFFRAILHVLRAEWSLAAGDREAAGRELLWSGNYDIVGQPGAPVQSEDADWALGTLARWRRTRITPDGPGRELCRDLSDVARLWAGGELRYRARADSAAQRRGALGCVP